MSLRNDIVSFVFLGYRGDLRIELQAPVIYFTRIPNSPGATSWSP